MEKISREVGQQVGFNKEAHDCFLRFAKDPASEWTGNFRDLNAAITRMATLSGNQRISEALVEEEIGRLSTLWRSGTRENSGEIALLESIFPEEMIPEMDQFDLVQLSEVIRIFRKSRSLSEAGRKLFACSREKRKSANDSDRVRKYLTKFGLNWNSVTKPDESVRSK